MGCGSSPQLPNYGQQAQQAVLASLNTFPQVYMTNAQASLGQGQFAGLGDAQNAQVMSTQMAQALLDIQHNYSPAYIQERLRELQASDPQGYAARQQLFNQILQQAQEQPNRPLASDLQNQINQTLTNAGQLDPRMLQEVQQQVRGGQVARGNYLGAAANEQEAAGVLGASQQSQDAAQQQALSYLQAGVSPQDVAYRRLQQSLGNLSSFIQGQTPTAQFGSLSGAQSGIVPFTSTGANQGGQVNMNAAAQGAQNALQIYGGQVNWAQSQVNPYMAGLSTTASSLGALGQLGWNPFASSNPATQYGTAWYAPQTPSPDQLGL